jgi:3-hydroxy-D-aspartate aldolase
MKVQDIPTPALLLEAGIFKSNLTAMAEHGTRTGKKLRPHAKAHKCPEIARRQIEAGAVGVCAATVAEAELMVRAGIPGVLLTGPVADAGKCSRIAALCEEAPDFTTVADHPEQVSMYGRAAGERGVTLNVLIDLDVGDHRTGAAPGDTVLSLARQIMEAKNLRFRGLQAYSVRASHLRHDEGRAEYSITAMQVASEMKELLVSNGIEVEVVTGGSTGTYESDALLPYITELQAGSYALMDRAYARAGGIEFGHALTVMATAISANHDDRVTVDAGFKAFSTDRPFGPEAADISGLRYEWAGDEFGYVFLDRPSQAIRLGDRLRFIPPHCDPTVNLYDRIYVCSGDDVEDIWPVMDRATASSLTPVGRR